MPTVRTTDVHTAAAALAAGRLVAFATETVYGLGAAADNAAAVAALYRAKNRPPDHPVIVHLASFAQAAEWAAALPAAAQALVQRYAPGPLTLLLPRRQDLPDVPHAPHLPGGALIALRVPAHPQARALLHAFDGGVVAPSANRFGALSPTCAAHVASEFAAYEEELLILDGGDCTVGIESTIVGFVEEAAYIARPGGISAQEIADAGVQLVPAPKNIAAPGTLARHYAPRTPLYLLDENEIVTRIAGGASAAVLSPQRVHDAVAWRAASADAVQYAHNLYRHLRDLDASGAEMILVATPPQTPAWDAIHDRLQRAATQ